MTPCIVFTGGGTAGHVTPNMAVIQVLQQQHWQIHYMGGAQSIEQQMITKLGIPFYAVRSGKLRRYWSWKNFIDPLNMVIGIFQAWYQLARIRPHVVFSKGGFAAFPVVVAAWLRRIPVIAHESDRTPGLANRLSYPFVRHIALTFPPTSLVMQASPKVTVTGTPIRQALFEGDAVKGRAYCGLNAEQPCLLIIGGSLGAQRINQAVRTALPQLLPHYQVIHLCGKGKVDTALKYTGYCQLEYVDQELPDLLAASDIVISRAGANSLCELLALNKCHILIPLSKAASRGDQIENARYFQDKQISVVIQEEHLNTDRLLVALDKVQTEREAILKRISQLNLVSGTDAVVTLIQETLGYRA